MYKQSNSLSIKVTGKQKPSFTKINLGGSSKVSVNSVASCRAKEANIARVCTYDGRLSSLLKRRKVPFSMKMFEYGSDISVFHGALVSTVGKAMELLEMNKNEQQVSKEDVYMKLKKEHCTKISYAIAQAFHEVASELESSLSSDELNCRVHASAFHAAMSLAKSNNTESYFESLDGVLPNISWTLYFELVKALQWSRYFIECIAALPLGVARKVVKLAIKHLEEDPIDSDTLLLDCCIQITFKHSYAYINDYISHKEDQKQNDKGTEVPNIFSQEIIPTSLRLMNKGNAECIHTLCSSINMEDDKSTSSIIKLSISTLLALFNCVKRSKYEEFTSDFMQLSSDKTSVLSETELCERLCGIPLKKEEVMALVKCTEDLIKEACEILISEKGKAFIKSMCKELGNIQPREKTSFDSLFFQFTGYLKEFITMCSSVEFGEDFQSILSSFNKVMAILDECELKKNVWLSKVHSLLLWSADISLDKYHVMMDGIIGRNNTISEESVLQFLERNIDLLCKPTYINVLMDVILNSETLEKQRVIKILLDGFQSLKTKEQEELLQIFINSLGVTEVFKTSDFNTQLVHFLNQIVKEGAFVNKIKAQVLVLCLQSPQDFIRQIIIQGTKNRGGISALAQVLKIIPFICNYKDDSYSHPLLVKCFCDIIETEELSKQQQENMVILIRELLQYRNGCTYEVLSSEDVLTWCILPNLEVYTNTSLLDLSIDILQAVTSEVKFWSEKIRKVAVVRYLYQVLEHYTKEKNGEKRQMIMAVINLLMSQESSFTKKDIRWLEACVKDVNPVWHLWLECKFFNKDIEKEQLEEIPLVDVLIGGSFGLTREMSSSAIQTILRRINDDLRYPYLVISLSKVLLYSTSEEWIFCFDAVVTSIGELQTSPIIQSFSKDIRNSNKNVTKAFHAFVDALLLIQSTDLPDIQWHFMISCFNKLVKHTLNDIEDDKMFIGFISCEICRLATVLGKDYTTDITVALLDIAGFWKDNYSTEGHLKAVLLNAIDTISSFDAVENLKKILN